MNSALLPERNVFGSASGIGKPWITLFRHPGEGWDPRQTWMPAFAGMTI
jgi:hypothetical protein